jgi:DNA primase
VPPVSTFQRRTIGERVAAVRGAVAIGDIVAGAIKMGRGHNARGKCPFHGSKSDSFTVYPDSGRARCWGCQWSGDAIEFVKDFYGLTFIEALERLEGDHGLDGVTAAPVQRARNPVKRVERPRVDAVVFGRLLWKLSVPDLDAVRTYLRARGVPECMLSAERLADIRFVPMGPIAAWEEGGDWRKGQQAPAMVALMRIMPETRAVGVHATFLTPALTGKMKRKRRDGSDYPDRKMLGPAGGAGVLLPGAGGYSPDCPLFEGEGIETTLSGMAIAGAAADACGLAALSLNNLQGHWRTIKGALPIYDPRPDPERQRPIAFERRGPVTGLIDADMAPLTGWRSRRTGEIEPPLVIESRGAKPVRRTITSMERSEICAALFVRSWAAVGVSAGAMRPRMGMDFNDVVRVG